MFLLDLLFPIACLSCGALGSYICLDCQKKLRLTPPSCIYCGRLSYGGYTHPLCLRKNGIDGMLSVFAYDPTMKKIIKNIKYRLVKNAFNELFELIPASVIKILGEWLRKEMFVFQPIPLHKLRLNERGFNQANTITKHIAKHINLSIVDILERIKFTPPQARLSEKQKRHLNVRGAFIVKPKFLISNFLISKNVILVDDVVTSGATVKEAARILKQAGVKNVFVFSLARG